MSDLDDVIVHDDSLNMEVDSDLDSMASLSMDSAADSGTNKKNFVCRYLF